MNNENSYTGPETEEAYLAWLAVEYPQSAEFPVNSIWSLRGVLYQIVGYCEFKSEPGLKVVALPTPAWESLGKMAENIKVSSFRKVFVRKE